MTVPSLSPLFIHKFWCPYSLELIDLEGDHFNLKWKTENNSPSSHLYKEVGNQSELSPDSRNGLRSHTELGIGKHKSSRHLLSGSPFHSLGGVLC